MRGIFNQGIWIIDDCRSLYPKNNIHMKLNDDFTLMISILIFKVIDVYSPQKGWEWGRMPSSTRLETVGQLGMLLGISSFRKTGMIQMISGSGLIQMIQNARTPPKRCWPSFQSLAELEVSSWGYLEIIQLNSLYNHV